jgi:hypothetical protein
MALPHRGFFIGDDPSFERIAKQRALDVESAHLVQRRKGIQLLRKYGHEYAVTTMRKICLGELAAVLPTEIWIKILSFVDTLTVLNFGSINIITHGITREIANYDYLARHPKLLDSVRYLQLRNVRMAQLVDCLRNEFCYKCGQWGDYILTLDSRRICYPCLSKKCQQGKLSVFPSSFCGSLGLDYENAPSATVPPARWGICASSQENTKLISCEDIGRNSSEAPKGNSSLVEALWPQSRDDYEAFHFRDKDRDPRRFMCALPAMFEDAETGEWHAGFRCALCFSSKEPLGCSLRRYTRHGLKEHLLLHGIGSQPLEKGACSGSFRCPGDCDLSPLQLGGQLLAPQHILIDDYWRK